MDRPLHFQICRINRRLNLFRCNPETSSRLSSRGYYNFEFIPPDRRRARDARRLIAAKGREIDIFDFYERSGSPRWLTKCGCKCNRFGSSHRAEAVKIFRQLSHARCREFHFATRPPLPARRNFIRSPGELERLESVFHLTPRTRAVPHNDPGEISFLILPRSSEINRCPRKGTGTFGNLQSAR